MRKSLEIKSQQLIVAQHEDTAVLGVQIYDINYMTGGIKSPEHLTHTFTVKSEPGAGTCTGSVWDVIQQSSQSPSFESKILKKKPKKTPQNKTATLTELIKARTLRRHMQLIPNYYRGLINAELKSENSLTITAIWRRMTVCGNKNNLKKTSQQISSIFSTNPSVSVL